MVPRYYIVLKHYHRPFLDKHIFDFKGGGKLFLGASRQLFVSYSNPLFKIQIFLCRSSQVHNLLDIHPKKFD